METTDECVELKAQEALALSPLLALRRLDVHHNEDRLVITGRVATFYQKQQAQELVRNVAEGLHVVNEVEVT